MKIWITLAMVFCLVFCLCSCSNDAKTNEDATTTVATVEATEEVTTAPTEEETVAPTEAETQAENVAEQEDDNTITEDEAIEMVKNKYQFGEGYGYVVRSTEEINGISYYGVDLRKYNNGVSSYQTTYFVTTDGSDIIEGYYENDNPVLVGPKNEITEDEAIEMVKNEYQFGEDYGYTVRGVEEIDGFSYFAVDLRKYNNGVSSYQTTYFVAVNGSEIVEGYYEGDNPVLVD